MSKTNYLIPENREARFVRNLNEIAKENSLYQTSLTDICRELKNNHGVVLTELDAGRYLLKASDAPDFAKPTFHCANCGTDFQLPDAEDKVVGGEIQCPECYEWLDKTTAQMENDETAKQVAGARIRPDAYGWSLPDAVRRKVYKKLGAIEAGQRGHSGTSIKADAASQQARDASDRAEQSGDPVDHNSAATAHAEAVKLHKDAQKYHTKQFLYHSEKSDATPDANIADADINGDTDGAELDCELSAARSYIGGNETLPDWIPYMPGGIHRITPSQGGKPVTVVVEVNEMSAHKLEEQRKALEATGNKPYFSLEHDSDIAAFWPSKFVFATRKGTDGKLVSGVWAEGEWSNSGRQAVEGMSYRSFSPTFHVNSITNSEKHPAKIISQPRAKLNMGAILNDPAFDKMPALWS